MQLSLAYASSYLKVIQNDCEINPLINEIERILNLKNISIESTQDDIVIEEIEERVEGRG